jgi:hypothetical protein
LLEIECSHRASLFAALKLFVEARLVSEYDFGSLFDILSIITVSFPKVIHNPYLI